MNIKQCGRLAADVVCVPFVTTQMRFDPSVGRFVTDARIYPPHLCVPNGKFYPGPEPEDGLEEGEVEWPLPHGWKVGLIVERGWPL